jgi:hypothetical protein
MSTARPIKAWNVLDCGLSRGVTGHHHWEAKAFSDELVLRGNKLRLFTTVKAPDPAPYAGVEIIPTFSLFLYQTLSNDPAWSTIENFVLHNRSFHRDLSRLDPSLFEDSVTIFPTLGENQILGLIRWLAEFPKDKRPRVATGLMAPQDFTPGNTRAQFYKNVFRKYLSEGGNNIAPFSRTPQCAAMIEKLIGVKTNVFPHLAPDALLARRPRSTTAGTSPWWFRSSAAQDANAAARSCRSSSSDARVQAFNSSSRRRARSIPRRTRPSCARLRTSRMCASRTAQ